MNPQLRQGMKLAWLGDAIVIRVLPQTQRGKDRIEAVNTLVAVSAARRCIVRSERMETIRSCRNRLGRVITKQFTAVSYRSIAVPIKGKERIIGTR